MEPAKRIIVNTGAQYAKAIINIGLSLYSTRLVLDALSISDYGIYAVVGGVVSMLGFITNALVITTQRYVSFHSGRTETDYVGRVFSNSLLLHVIFASFIAIVLLSLKLWLFNGVLNIPAHRIPTAIHVYYIAILMLCFTIVTAPFKAMFIAHENIVYVAAVEVVDGILKLLFAIGLYYVSADKLMVYASYMLLIQILNFLAFALYAKFRFAECSLAIRRRDIDKTILRQLTGFAGWNTYSAGTTAARSQGISVIINHFMGTAVNAAYGVAAQIHSSVAFVSSSIINAMNPQIMKAEGSDDRRKVLMLAGQESKYSVALLSMACIPLLMELQDILQMWLKEVPENTAMFCTFTLVTCLCDQFTIGLNAVNQAQGRIRNYTLITFTPKLLNIPMAWFVLLWGWPVETIMWIMLVTETLMALFRLPYLKRTAGLDIAHYLRHYVLPLIPLIATLIIVSWGCTQLFHFKLRFLLTITVSVLCGGIVALFFTLSKKERAYIVSLIKSKVKKS